jgi:glycosyltransferase involved in cell wall biosynthesis
MVDLTVIILTYNEEIHIERCIRSLESIVKKIFIVDSFSTDKTVGIAESLGAIVKQRKWKNYADQFQWGLDNCGTGTEWVMRMDADEYLEPDLQNEIIETLPTLSEVSGIYLKRKHIFEGKFIRYGDRYPLVLLRIWRNGKGRIEQRWMDEHIVLPQDSKTITLNHNIVDENIKGITFFVEKHNSYATREAIDLLNNRYPLFDKDIAIMRASSTQAKIKRIVKDKIYFNLPIGFRPAIYFFYRYIIRLGFLDGKKGFIYHFLQGFWYRLLVDIKVNEIEEKSKGDVNIMKQVLQKEYGILID